MALLWYALRTKPRKEDVVWRQVQSEGFESYYPRLKVNPINPRARRLVPYFPGYIFIRIDLDSTGLSIVQWMPHTVGLVSFGGDPSPVPDHLIGELQKRVKDIMDAGGELFQELKAGDQVKVLEGPFKGFDAIFDSRLPGSERVKVLLAFMSNPRQVAVEMDAGQIARKR
jgi:transcription antitermination factor NusG